MHDRDSAITDDELDNEGIQHHIDDQSRTYVGTSSHRLLQTFQVQLPLHLSANGRPNSASKHQVHCPQDWRRVSDVQAGDEEKDPDTVVIRTIDWL